MSIIYIVIAAIAIIVLVVFITTFFLPSKVRVARSIAIQAVPERIFRQINILRNWPDWSPWHQYDHAMQIVYNDIPEGKGAAYRWESKNRRVGNGSLTIIASHPFESIAVEMNFMRRGTANAYFRLEPRGETTQLTWSLETDMGHSPGRRLMGWMMDKFVGADFERGLLQLKKITETI